MIEPELVTLAVEDVERFLAAETERAAVREALAGLLLMMRPEWIPDAQAEARRVLERRT